MKIVRKALDKVRPAFEEGGRMALWRPVFLAADHFFFAAAYKPENPPYGRDPMDVKRYMFMVVIALTPAFLASVYFFGWRILLMLLVSYAAGGVVEVLFAAIRKEEINEGFLISGFIFPLILPPGIPLWMVAVGIVFGTLVGKEVFGGTGRNLFNPALVGRCFLALGYPAAMTSTWVAPATSGWGRVLTLSGVLHPEAVTSATPLVVAKSGELASPHALFLGRVAGSMGETCVPAILLGGLFLIALGIANWRTVVGILGSFVVLNIALRLVAPDAVNPLWFNLMSGGLMFGAFFMATDPVGSPLTSGGKWVYGALIGVLTLLIRSFSGFVEGMMFAILFGNIAAPLIDQAFIRLRIRRYALEG